jgi:CMP/dCMP kinase
MTSQQIIAIDGPAGSGKSTVARALSDALGLATLDTGACYRAVTLACLEAGIDLHDAEAVTSVAESAQLSIDASVVIDGRDVTGELRSEAVNHGVSLVAANPGVRSAMVAWQRRWAEEHGGGVIEGRDIGSVVFPHATVKLFLTASPEERARRRTEESSASVERRDRLDSTRAHSPLAPAPGSVEIDTTTRSVDEVVTTVLGILEGANDEVGATDRPPASSRSATPGRGVNFELDPRSSLFYRFARSLLHALGRLCFRPSVAGPGRIPETGPAIIAPVHRSNLDFMFAIYVTRRKIFFMAKDSLWRWRWFGRLLVLLGAFPVHREGADRSAMANAEAVLAAGEVLVLFPEGTRREGPVVEELLEGAAFLSARAQAPVLPLGLAGTDRAMPKGARIFRPTKVHLHAGELIQPPERSGRGRIPRSAVHRHSEDIQRGLQAAYDAAKEEAAS